MKLKRLTTAVLYTLFFTVTVVFFIYLLFPEKKAAQFFSDFMGKPTAALQFSCEKIQLLFPFSLNIENSKFIISNQTDQDNKNKDKDKDNQIEIKPDSFKVELSPALFSKKNSRKIICKLDLYHGALKGDLYFQDFSSLLLSKTDLSISDIKINNFRYKTTYADMVIDCLLNGFYEYNRTNETNLGKGKLVIQDFSGKMANSILSQFNLQGIDFKQIKIDFEHNSNIINITQCIAKGPVMTIKLKGKINIAAPFGDALLDLEGVVLPNSLYLAKFVNMAFIKAGLAEKISQQGINFRISGTLNKPEISI